MDRFFSHLKQPFTSVWLSVGFVVGCIITVYYYQTLVFTVFALSLLIASAYFKPFYRVLLGFICGILCVWGHFSSFYAISSLALDENKPHLSNITIVEVISQRDNYYLKVQLNEIDNQPLSNIKPPFALLTLKNDQRLKVGDHVTTWLELEKYRSQKNYDVFDKERYAFSERLFFKGKQVGSIIEISNNHEFELIEKYRNFIKLTYQHNSLNWLFYPLMTGDRSAMSFSQKQELQQFGISHLLAISGLHIGLMFSIGFFITRYLTSLFIFVVKPTTQQINLSLIYSLGGFVLAFSYVYLSGFIVSATRALIMLGCYLVIYYFAKQALRWRFILFALVCVLLIDPFSLLNPGLYFSFTAVAIIFWVFSVITVTSSGFLAIIKTLIILQLALFIGLLPLSLYYFNGVSVIGLVVNLVAIPLLGLIIMPCLVMFSAISVFFDISGLISVFDSLLQHIYQLLLLIPVDFRWFDTTNFSQQWLISSYITAIIVCFLPWRLLACIPLLLVVLDHYLLTKPRWQLNVFDVGHGTMVLVSNRGKGFIYDLGPIYFNTFTRVNSTLIPYLKRNGIEAEVALISHMDKDHAGGLIHWLEQGYQHTFKLLQPNGPEQVCRAGEYSFYDLTITVSEPAQHLITDNDNSCVVRISDGRFSVLLPGDISATREAQLIQQQGVLKSTVLLSPHHGSNTSSSDAFIAAVAPEIVIHSTAYKGQWQFPRTEVIARYATQHALQYTTANKGQVKIEFYPHHYTVNLAREDESYWFLKD
ncbi:DNA internalization-related competence protein ComEC/Rec2 [Pseudoalteromonas sp. SG41-2]|uniref:DNA internalization-related competence protein ComEC/Rec2 n=1 Tax=Pseudoalteromonas sp. SG41-2 TaxID=2760978 RepID=UPI0015FEEC24|nr:DNA internalization-related competence protein ComEC/Rec2 [Pseudoalteromonas sp. SG41-2]MBB1479961.1 DNA internalization-related competence protein ComEC/Rec2 [Pseudoalteromonas sp. SG41-2]